MPGLIFVIVVVIVMIGVFFLSAQRTRQNWGEAARRLGIQFESASFGHPRIAGDIEGFGVVIDVKGSGDNTRTRYRVVFPPLGAEFRLKREGGTQKIMRALGVDDVQIGEAEFDDAFDVATDHPEELRALLTPARRFALLRLFAIHSSLVVTEHSMDVTTKRLAKDPKKIEGIARRLVATAHALQGTTGTAAVNEALATRAAGDLRAALDKLEKASADNPDDAELRLLAAEAALAAGEREQAASGADSAARALPGDDEAERMVAAARTPPPGPAPPPPPAVPAAPSSDGTAGVDTDSVDMFQEIFGRARLSFESGAEFDRRYKGQRVQWSGEVRSIRPYETDLDFGAGPGTKTVVGVASIRSDLYGNAEIDAVVALPAGLRFERGERITFAGTLHKVDAMMRNVFVADGRLVSRT